MSEIKKSERTESKLEVIHNAYAIRMAVTKIAEKDFLGKLSNVIIENTENNTRQEYGQMELIQILKYEDGYYFALRELTQQELDNIKIQSNIDYIAMMSNIDLEEGDLA